MRFQKWVVFNTVDQQRKPLLRYRAARYLVGWKTRLSLKLYGFLGGVSIIAPRNNQCPYLSTKTACYRCQSTFGVFYLKPTIIPIVWFLRHRNSWQINAWSGVRKFCCFYALLLCVTVWKCKANSQSPDNEERNSVNGFETFPRNVLGNIFRGTTWT
jgi:hypothetical protein